MPAVLPDFDLGAGAISAVSDRIVMHEPIVEKINSDLAAEMGPALRRMASIRGLSSFFLKPLAYFRENGRIGTELTDNRSSTRAS
jgi:hypothetical protein